MVFKGGTCLKKCYFETYRFSEDLDFTLRGESHIDEKFLRRVLEEVVAWVAEQSGLIIPADQLESDIYENPRGRFVSAGLRIIPAVTRTETAGRIERRQRLGGLLNYYHRKAA